MVDPVKPTVRVLQSAEQVASASAGEVVADMANAVRRRGRATWLLSGGSTPRQMYEAIAVHYVHALDWKNISVFWGDERFVPSTSQHSNFRMAAEAMLSALPIPPEQIYPIPTGFANPDDAAVAYEYTMGAYFNDRPPDFDVVLLGMGIDGHTASLFPGSSAIRNEDRWVVATEAPAEPIDRITVTFPVLNGARSVHILATGSAKAAALSRAFGSSGSVEDCPVRGVKPTRGQLVWWIDRGAAEALEGSSAD